MNMELVSTTPYNKTREDGRDQRKHHHVDTLSALLAVLRGTASTPTVGFASSIAYSSPLTDLGDVFSVEEALKHSIFVHTLSLQGCNVGDQAAEALARALATNSVLQCLDLRDNHITTIGATFFANALAQHNCTLQELRLDGNPCSNDDIMRSITSALVRNQHATQTHGTPTAATPAGVLRSALLRDWAHGVQLGTPMAAATPCVVREGEYGQDEEPGMDLRLGALEAQQHNTTEQLDRLHMLLMQVETWKVQVDLASNQLGMVLGVLEKEHAGVRFRLDETHTWLEDVAQRCERANQTSSSLHSAMQQTQQQQAACMQAVGALMADVQRLMQQNSRRSPLSARKRTRVVEDEGRGAVTSFPIELSSDEDEEEEEDKEEGVVENCEAGNHDMKDNKIKDTQPTAQGEDEWGPMLAAVVGKSEKHVYDDGALRTALAEQQVATQALQQQTQDQADHIARLEAELAGVRTIMQRLHNSSARLLRLSPRSSGDACEQASPVYQSPIYQSPMRQGGCLHANTTPSHNNNTPSRTETLSMLRASASKIPRAPGGEDTTTTTAQLRLTPLLARGGEAMDKLGRLKERVAALRDRLSAEDGDMLTAEEGGDEAPCCNVVTQE